MSTTTDSPYVPDSIRQQKADAERLAQDPQQAPAPAATTQDDPPATPVPSPAPAEPSPQARIQSEIAELTARRDAIQTEIQQITGRYGAQLQKRDGIIKDQQEIISRLEAEMAELRKAAPANPTAGTTPAGQDDEWKQHYTPEEIEQWGDEFCRNDYARLKRLAGSAHPKPEDDRVKKLERDIEATKHETALRNDQEFLARMDAIVPGFSTLNGSVIQSIPADPRWSSFLDSTDPSTLMKWRDLATAAVQQGNLPRLAEIARMCMGKGTAPATTASAPGGTAPQVPPLESQLAVPTVQTDAPNPGTAGQRVVRQSEINLFNQEIRQNPTKYSPEDRKKKLSEFETAIMSGQYIDDTAR